MATATGTPTLADLTAVLIDAGSIPGDTFTRQHANPFNRGVAVGVEAVFGNAANTRALSDVLLRFPTEAQAAAAFTTEAKPSLGGQSLKPGFTDGAVEVGQQAHIFSGTATDSGPAVLLVFQEGNYVVTMELLSVHPTDAVPNSVAIQVAQAQDAKLKG